MKKIYFIDFTFAVLIILVLFFSNVYVNDLNSQNETIIKYGFDIIEKDCEISALYSFDNLLYVGTNNGLHVYDISTKDMIMNIDDINMIYTASIIGDNKEGVWVGHETGLSHFTKDFVRQDYKYPDIPKGRVNTIVKVENKIYCGTYNGAAILEEAMNGNKWDVVRILNKSTGLLSDSVNVILPLKESVMFGSYQDLNGGITIVNDNGTIQYLTKENGLPHTYITSAINYDDYLLVGTGFMNEGALVKICKIDDEYIIEKVFTKYDGLPGEKIRFLFADADELWITTESDGVLISAQNKKVYLTKNNGLCDNEIKCIIKANNEYYLGSKYGLNYINDYKIKEILDAK